MTGPFKYSPNYSYNDVLRKYCNFSTVYPDDSETFDNIGCAITYDKIYSYPIIIVLFSSFHGTLCSLAVPVDYCSNRVVDRILILIYSLSAFHSILNFYKNNQHPISQKTVETLLMVDKEITLVWVPSYSNIPQNQQANSRPFL